MKHIALDDVHDPFGSMAVSNWLRASSIVLFSKNPLRSRHDFGGTCPYKHIGPLRDREWTLSIAVQRQARTEEHSGFFPDAA